jgi:hypothetical protein
MLVLSDEAATLIRSLARASSAPAGSGLRISVDGRYDSLSMALAPLAGRGDVVVKNRDTPVFLTPAASARLSGRTLSAGSSHDRSSFYLT